MYLFNPKDFNTSHDEICRYNGFNSRILHVKRGWRSHETAYFRENTLKITFLMLFKDVGEIQQIKQNRPEPKKIK